MTMDVDFDGPVDSRDDSTGEIPERLPSHDGGARRRLEAVLEERRIRRELAELGMDDLEMPVLSLYE